VAAAIAVGAVLCGSAMPAPAELFAERLTPENLAARRIRGPDAIAGLGDYVLGNGTVCAAVSDPDHESTLSDRGGVLIDLGHCGRDDDQWVVLQPMRNLSRANVLPVAEVSARVAGGEARIETRGEAGGLAFTTVYALDERAPTRLRIETRVERQAPGEALFLFGDVALHGHRQLAPFTLADVRPGQSPGFRHPEIEIDSAWSMVDAMVRADTQVLVGDARLAPPVSYGWRIVDAGVEREDGSVDALAHLALNGEHFSILGVYADTLLVGGKGRPGMLELAQTLLMDLEPGDRLVYVREIVLGRRADVASVTDQLWQDGPRVVGSVDDPEVAIRVLDAGRDRTPITFVRPGADGRFSFRLPPARTGDVVVEAWADDALQVTRRVRIDPGDAPVDLGLLPTDPAAVVELPRGEPLRLVFRGAPPTVDAVLRPDGVPFFVGAERVRSASESSDLSLAGTADDPTVQRLAPGRYRVWATRGPEWSVSEAVVSLAPGERQPLVLEPPVRVVEPRGFVSADLHVHAAPSDDSALPVRDRIASFAAQGADVIVATEHDHVFDYGPTIRAMGLGDRIASLSGAEVTSTVVGSRTPFTSGHANAFPLEPLPDAYRGGAPRAENQRLRDIVGALRALPARPVLQLNHPRESGFDRGLGSYFTHLAVLGTAFEPGLPLIAPANAALSERDARSGLRDVDFDAVELLNGPSMDRYRLTRADWLSLLLQGEFRTGTANSDSHGAHTLVALPRNYVAYDGPRGRDFDVAAFVAALRAGRSFGSTGPLLDVRLGEAGPGDLHRGASGELRIRVDRAPWVPVDELRVYVDGTLVHRAPVPETGALRLPLHFERDAFVTVEVEGLAAAGSTYAILAPGFTPFAFTNPIFVDADGRPGWTAPGLGPPVPSTIAIPLESR
jgi:hypothetical protein